MGKGKGQAMRKLPVILVDESKPVGEMKLPADVAKEIANRKLSFGFVSRGPDAFTQELVHVTLNSDPWEGEHAGHDDSIRTFFKEARQLVKDEVGEGEDVGKVILNKLKLLAALKSVKEGDPLKLNLEGVEVSPAFVRILLGGEWPSDEESGGFGFDEVAFYKFEDGAFVGYDGLGSETPGPDFRLNMIPFLIRPGESPHWKLIKYAWDRLRTVVYTETGTIRESGDFQQLIEDVVNVITDFNEGKVDGE